MLSFYNLKDLELRKRIDGINFTAIIPCTEIEEFDDEEQKRWHKAYLIESMFGKISQILPFAGRPIEYLKSKSVVDLNSSIGIYLESFFKGNDQYVLIQFKGSFFVHSDAFNFCRSLVKKITAELDTFFRLTLIDVAQDFLAPIQSILPYPEHNNSDVKYCFKHKCSKFNENCKNRSLLTGFFISTGRYKITIYDKKAENQRARNKLKKSYYKKIFEKYKDKPVTRVELRLKQEACRKLLSCFFDFSISEEKFLRIALFQLYRKHKLRIKPVLSNDKDFRRWPIHPHWKHIFCQISQSDINDETTPDYLYTTPSSDLDRSISKLVETLAVSYPCIGTEELEEKLLSLPLDEIISKVQNKIKRRERTIEKLEALKFQLLNPDRFDTWSTSGAVGISISSPLERSEIKKLNT
jgi:hypothetical protein